MEELTEREQEVLMLTAWECLSAKEIASKLSISPVTAQNHIHNIKLKLKLQKITELSKYWFLKNARHIGATVLLLLFSINLLNSSANDICARRVRRGRGKTELCYESDF